MDDKIKETLKHFQDGKSCCVYSINAKRSVTLRYHKPDCGNYLLMWGHGYPTPIICKGSRHLPAIKWEEVMNCFELQGIGGPEDVKEAVKTLEAKYGYDYMLNEVEDYKKVSIKDHYSMAEYRQAIVAEANESKEANAEVYRKMLELALEGLKRNDASFDRIKQMASDQDDDISAVGEIDVTSDNADYYTSPVSEPDVDESYSEDITFS